MQAIVKCSLLYLVCGGQRKHWQRVLCRSIDLCKQLWDVRFCIQYEVVSVSIDKVFDAAASISASNCGMFIVVFSMLW